MKAKVDAELCTGCGPCADICPEVFELADDIAEVKGNEVPADSEDACKEAMEGCPTEAISIEE